MPPKSMCVLCKARPEHGVGEHIWPSWYLRDLDKTGPPASGWARNGEPILNRRDVQIHLDERQRVLIPACEPCNTELNRRFEDPAKPIIRRLMGPAGWTGEATAEEWKIVGLWFAKVLLLLGHPEARYSHPTISKHAVKFDVGTPDLSWLIDSSPPPTGLSLWVFKGSTIRGKPEYVVPTPRSVRTPDGDAVDFHYLLWASSGMCVTLLSHSGWPIEHPLVEQGHAWELLHGAQGGDLSALQEHSFSAITWTTFDATLKEGFSLDGTLPPLRAVSGFPVDAEVLNVVSAYQF
ncbi:hypothetical protein [Actinoplanes sp. URMC 104]|uniref:hypothetical protein n=1 Tax=Actinoplanes sp. URMC 104 TaxID=3423409 RepID=UPI003F1BA7E3